MVATSTVTASPRSQPEVFYRQTVFRIARSWARVPNAAWDRVKDPLFSQCPHALGNHTVRKLHFLSKNSTLITRENCRFFWGEKLVKMLWFWTF